MCARMQDGWEHMPHDILVAVVKAAGPGEARAMHLTCKAWHTAVRCGLTQLTPRPKQCCFEGVRCFFPRVRPPLQGALYRSILIECKSVQCPVL